MSCYCFKWSRTGNHKRLVQPGGHWTGNQDSWPLFPELGSPFSLFTLPPWVCYDCEVFRTGTVSHSVFGLHLEQQESPILLTGCTMPSATGPPSVGWSLSGAVHNSPNNCRVQCRWGSESPTGQCQDHGQMGVPVTHGAQLDTCPSAALPLRVEAKPAPAPLQYCSAIQKETFRK